MSESAATQKRGRLRAWLNDRAGLDRLVEFGKVQALKPVPKNLSWVYTLGGMAAFFFGLQFFTGFLLLMHYAPNADVAFETVRTIQHKAAFGWLFRQMHSWGASFIVIVLFLHMLKVLWYGSYKRPREFTWFVGVLLFAIAMTFCFTGYVLPWNQLAKWATSVGAESIGEVPGGVALKRLILGSDNVTGSTLGRFFAVHIFLLPLLLGGLMVAHLVLVRWKGITPKLSVKEEVALGEKAALEKVGAEPFFPRQVYRDLLAMLVGFALLVTVATFLPWHLGEPASNATPPGVKPEWYFLPVYQLLKYFSVDFLGKHAPGILGVLQGVGLESHLKLLGIATVNGFLLVVFLLPVLDRGKQRKIWKRPFFALLATVTLVAVVGLGVLGAISDRTLTAFGTTFRFDLHGFPTAAAEGEGAPDAPAENGQTQNNSSGDTGAGGAGDPDGDAAGETGGSGTGGAGEADSGDAAEEEAEEEAEAEAAAADESTAAQVAELPPGGTCGDADCHKSQHRDWSKSVHAEHGIVCVNCHGGNDRSPIDFIAHVGILTEDGTRARIEVLDGTGDEEDDAIRVGAVEVMAPEDGRQIVDTCTGSGCHGDVLTQFSRAAHLDEDLGEVDCKKCHSNHKVVAAGIETYEKASSRVYKERDAGDDPRAAAFTEIHSKRLAWEKERQEIRGRIDPGLEFLKEKEFPVEYIQEDIDKLPQAAEAIAVSTHSLDPKRVEARIDDARLELTAIEAEVVERRASIETRWHLVVGVWGLTVLSALFLIRKLRSFRDEPRRDPGIAEIDYTELEETKKFSENEADGFYGAAALDAALPEGRDVAVEDGPQESPVDDADDAGDSEDSQVADTELDRQLAAIDLEGVDLEGLEPVVAESEPVDELEAELDPELEAELEATAEPIESAPAADAALGSEDLAEEAPARHEIAADPEPTPAAAVVSDVDDESAVAVGGVAPPEPPPANEPRSADELRAASSAAFDTEDSPEQPPDPIAPPDPTDTDIRTLTADAATGTVGEEEKAEAEEGEEQEEGKGEEKGEGS